MFTLKTLSLTFLLLSLCVVLSFSQNTNKPINGKITKPPTVQDLSKVIKIEKPNFVVLRQADKLKIVNDSLKGKGVTTVNSLSPTVKLSSTKPKLDDSNFLAYIKPWNVLTLGESVQFSEAESWMDSSLIIGFKPSSPGLYVFDISVKRVMDTNFNILSISENNSQKILSQSKNGYFTNLIFALSFKDNSPKSLIITADQSWSFYNCEISQAK